MVPTHSGSEARRARDGAAGLRPDNRVIDVAFPLSGGNLPADHALALLDAVRARLAWFGAEPGSGIHPLRANATDYGVALLARRAKLVLRVPEARVSDALALQGCALDVAGCRLRLGEGQTRPLRASATLAAGAVTFGEADSEGFERSVRAALVEIGVDCGFISGRRRAARAGSRTIAGFSLALHGLQPDDSLVVQALGLGGERALGWGLFVPAKAIA